MAWHAKETQSAGSTASPTPPSPADTPAGSPPTSNTSPARRKSTSSAGPSAAGAPRSSTGAHARHTNAPTEAAANLIKRIKRVAFGFRSFANYRIRALLYAGRPDWDLLPALTPP